MSSQPTAMSAGPDASPTTLQPRAAQRQGAGRYFWLALALFFVLVAALGFAPSYVDAAKGTYAIPPIVHVHGALMISWLVLFVVQTGLAAFGALPWHRTLGMAAVVLAVALWLSMGAVIASSLLRNKVEDMPWIYDITLAALTGPVLFPLFFTWGILVRRNGGAHKRLLTFAMLFMLQAAIDRMPWIPELPLPGFWSHAVRLYPLMLPLYVFDFFSLKRIHPMTLICTGIIVANHTFISHFWGNPGWHSFLHGIVSRYR